MAIHDDNWTKEMPDMYTISKRERVVSGLIAILMAMVLVSRFVPAIGQKEMPDMYTISKRERVVSGLIAILMAMVLVSLFVPAIGQYVMYVIGGAAVVGALYVLIASSYEVLTGKSFY